MPKKTIVSAIDIAVWFAGRANRAKQKISSQQLQNLLFLVQMHHLSNKGQPLIPSMFVCCDYGFYEPSVQMFINHNFNGCELVNFNHETEFFLETVWQKYTKISPQDLQKFITSLECWKTNFLPDEETIVNPLAIADSFLQSISAGQKSKSDRPKIRLSQHGPVEVSPWKPRKVKTNSSKKDNV